MLLHNKLDLNKPLIIQKYCCHKVPNQKNINRLYIYIYIYIFVLHQVDQQLDGNVPFDFLVFLKTLVREIEVNELNKISLIKTFVLFFKIFGKY